MSGLLPGAGAGSSSVASRFISQTQLTEAQKRREQEIKDAYARLGQEPPPESLAAAASASGGGGSSSTEYDPRSLFERLQANKDAKQEEWDERMKLTNQFRGIDASESDFLNDMQAELRDKERAKRQAEQQELLEFRKAAEEKKRLAEIAIAAAAGTPGAPPAGISPPRIPSASASPPPPPAAVAKPAPSTSKPAAAPKRKRDGLGLGIVRKKPAPAAAAKPTPPKPAAAQEEKASKVGSPTEAKAIPAAEKTAEQDQKAAKGKPASTAETSQPPDVS